MIYHQLFHPPKDRSEPIEWWAVHTPSLAIMRCLAANGTLHVNHAPRSVPVAVHLTGETPPDNNPVNREAIEAELVESIRNHFGHELRLGRSGDANEPVPEYILVTDDGEEDRLPGLLRTTDPTFIAWPELEPPADLGETLKVNLGPQCGYLGDPAWARSSRQLPGAGWRYWWEDAQDALENLTEEYLAAERRYLAD